MNKISLWALILTIPLFFNCNISHYCMEGHNAHGQLDNIFEFSNDMLIIILMAISLGLSLRDKRSKLPYYLYLLFSIFMIILMSIIGLIFYLFAIALHLYFHQVKEKSSI